MKKERGSISIFQTLIISVVLVVVLIIIDVSRLFYAISKVNSDVEIAIDSLMANYDKYLMSEYQIFTIHDNGSNGMKNFFIEYLEDNLNNKIKIDKEITTISGIENILISSGKDPLKEQIMEIMKYKGPIMLTEDLISKIAGTSIFDKSNVAKGANQVNTISYEIYSSEDKINVIIINNNIIIKKIKSEKFKRITYNEDINKIIEYNKSLVDLLTDIENVKENIKQYEMKISVVNKNIEQIEEEGVEPIFKEFSDFNSKIEIFEDEVGKNIGIIDILIINLESIGKIIDGFYNEILIIDEKKNELGEEIEQLNTIKNNYIKEINKAKIENIILDETLMGLKLLDKIGLVEEKEIEKLKNIIKGNNLIIEKSSVAMTEVISKIVALENKLLKLENDINNLEIKIDIEIEKANQFLNSANIIDINKLEMEEAIYNEEDRPDKLEQTKNNGIFNNLKNEIEFLFRGATIPMEWNLTNDDFDKIEQEKINRGMGIEDNNIFDFQNKNNIEVENEIKQKTKLLDDIMYAIKNTGENTLAKLFIIEYVMDMFTYHTSNADRNHYFRKGEIEYILNGDENEMKNINKNLINIGLLRTGINTIDYFIKSKVPSLFYRFVFAIGQGIIQATIDVMNLYQGKSVSLSPTIKKVELTYSDYLRLFLLLKEEGEILKSVKNLMNINIQNSSNSQVELNNFYTGAEIKVKLYIKLWTLDIIGELGIWDRIFHKDGYIYEKTFYRYY